MVVVSPHSLLQRLGRNWPALLAVATAALLTALTHETSERQHRQNLEQIATAEAMQYHLVVQWAIESYLDRGRWISTSFAASRNVSRDEFHRFVTPGLMQGHSSLLQVGFLARVPAAQKAVFEARARLDYPDYRIQTPASSTGDLYPYLHLAAQNARLPHSLLGVDVMALPEHGRALQQARDSGQPVFLSQTPVAGVNDAAKAILLYLPVYEGGSVPTSETARRQALRGYTVIGFDLKTALQSIPGSALTSHLDIEIYDGIAGGASLLHGNSRIPHALRDGRAFTAYRNRMEIFGRTWELRYYVTPAFFEMRPNPQSGFILITGLLSALLLFYLFWRILEQRALEKLHNEHTRQFGALIQHHPEAVYTLDAEGRISSANDYMVELLGIPTAELIGLPLLSLIDGREQADVARLLKRMSAGESFSGEIATHTASGDRVELFITHIPLLMGRTVQGSLGLAHNITEGKRAREALHQTRQMLQLVLDTVPHRIFWKDTACVLQGGNLAYARDLGLESPEQLAGLTADELLDKADTERINTDDLAIIQSGLPRLNHENALVLKNGEQRWVRSSKLPLRDSSGATIGMLGIYEDVTDEKIRDQQLLALHATLLKAQALGHIGHWRWSLQSDEVDFAEEVYRIFGRDPADAPSRDLFWEALHPWDRGRVEKAISDTVASAKPFRLELRIRRPQGEIRHIYLEAEVIRDEAGQPLALSGILQDITERKQLEMRLRELAHYDPLTGVANRLLIWEHLEKAVARVQRHRSGLALMYLDLDKFKEINDLYGHVAGDSLLREFARRLEGNIRSTDRVGRLGGDEFVIILEDLKQPSDAVVVAEKILQALQPPYRHGEHELHLASSIGIALYTPEHTLESLLQAADMAMYKAKRAGRGQVHLAFAPLSAR